MKPGPITNTCFPCETEASYEIQLVDLATDELIDRVPVRSNQNEISVFQEEIARCEALRARDADFEPMAVCLLLSDILYDRKEIA